MKKIIPSFVLLLAIICLNYSCTKDLSETNRLEPQFEALKITDGRLTYPSTNNFRKALESLTKEDNRVIQNLHNLAYSKLKNEQRHAGVGINNVQNIIDPSLYDSTLYTEFMKTALNEKKMMQIGNYVIKVDMDNNFCSAINIVDYPGADVDVLSNNFSRVGMMLFTNDQEPVLAVMDSINNSTYSFAQYEDDRARKGGQGICFRSGIDARQSFAPLINAQGHKLEAQVKYIKNFLHFQLSSYTYITAPFNATATVTGNFEWSGACSGSGSGNILWYAKNFSPGITGVTHYSGGSALSVAKIRARASNQSIGITNYAQFGY